MTLSVLAERLAVCRLDPQAELPAWATAGALWSVTRTADELSVICEDQRVPADLCSERGWRALMVHGPFDFSEIGVLLPIVAVLARAEVSVLVISTFDTDYVLVGQDLLSTACAALQSAGYELEQARGS